MGQTILRGGLAVNAERRLLDWGSARNNITHGDDRKGVRRGAIACVKPWLVDILAGQKESER
jgi:hypothetical protein